jgi:hypothetical protein
MSPAMTLELVAEPFISTVGFSEFKEPADPRAEAYENRYRELSVARNMGNIDVDLNDDGVSEFGFSNPDRSVTSLNANIVFRWEFLPGSFLYAIFSHAAAGEVRGDRDLNSDDYKAVLTSESESVFLMKLSYWWNH